MVLVCRVQSQHGWQERADAPGSSDRHHGTSESWSVAMTQAMLLLLSWVCTPAVSDMCNHLSPFNLHLIITTTTTVVMQ